MSVSDTQHERRAHKRSDLVLPADLRSVAGAEPVYVLDVSQVGFCGLLNRPEVPENVQLRFHLPGGDTIHIVAATRWTKPLTAGRLHAGFEIINFLNDDDQARFAQHLDQLTPRVGDVSLGTLRGLGKTELEGMGVLVRSSNALNSSPVYTESLESVLEVICGALGAERGLFLMDRGGPSLSVEAARGPDALSQRGLAFSETVARSVLETGEPALSLDTREDIKLGQVASLQILGTLSVLCVPLQARGRNFGLLYLDSSLAKGIFEDSDLALAMVIADLAASSIERAHYFEQALQREKLAALGTLVAGLAHELKNPLGALKNLGECWDEGLDREGDSAKVVDQAGRCIHLVKDLLRLSRGEKTKFTKVSIEALLDRLDGLVSTDIRSKNVSFRLLTQCDLPPVMGSEEQLLQVLLNLVTNAVAAVSVNLGGEVEVSTVFDRDLIRLSVADNGPGIPPSDIQRIFDPFVTTKSDGHGLGLSIIQRLVQDHGGVIRAQNGPEGGAIFTVELPIA